MSYCRNCGAKIAPNTPFCPVCGTPAGIAQQSGTPTGIAQRSGRPAGIAQQSGNPADLSARSSGNRAVMWQPAPGQQPSGYRPEAYRPEPYHNKKHRRRGGVPLPVVIVLLAAVIAGAVFFVLRSQKDSSSAVDLSKCLRMPSFEGISGEGTIVEGPYLDEDLVYNAFGKTKEYSGEDSQIPDLGPLMEAVTVSVDKNSELSNGDKVTVSLNYDVNYLEGKYNVRFTGSSASVTVDNLTTLTELDPFDKVVPTYSGIAPLAVVSIDRDSIRDSDMNKVFSNSDEISNSYEITVNGESAEDRCVAVGDKLELTLTDDGKELMKEKNYKPSADSKSVTVTAADVDSYVTKYSDITEENLKAIRSQCDDQINAYTASNNYNGHQADYKGTFFLVPKGGHWNRDMRPYLILIYSMQLTRGDEQNSPFTRYFCTEVGAPYNEAQKTNSPDTEAAGNAVRQLLFDNAYSDRVEQPYDSDDNDGQGRLFDDYVGKHLTDWNYLNADGLDDFVKLRRNMQPDESLA